MRKMLSFSALATLGIAQAAYAATSKYGLQDPESPIAREIYSLHTLILWICIAIFVLVFGTMFFAIIKHRKSVGHKAAHFHENTTVEVVWTIVPFVILMGMVVNNAILLTDETRTGERNGLSRREAIAAALRTRTRPIFSTTLSGLFGMLPLAVVPGPGSALYRGLGAVIVGGMVVNTAFTLVLLPALLRLGEAAPQPAPAKDPAWPPPRFESP